MCLKFRKGYCKKCLFVVLKYGSLATTVSHINTLLHTLQSQNTFLQFSMGFLEQRNFFFTIATVGLQSILYIQTKNFVFDFNM